MKSLLTFLLSVSALLANTKRIETDVNACNRDLMSAFGMEGRAKFEYGLLEMCPEVKKNCCLKDDQMQIYTNWVHAGEQEKVQKRYYNVTRNYTELIEELIGVQNFTERVVSRLSAKKVANCKILGERILNFDIKTIGPVIIESLNKTIEFWKDSHQGVYCSVCDQENHQYFNTSENKIVFSEQFCRDMTESTLPSMIYLHNHFVKYLNLITKFVMSCDFKGDFNLDAIVPTNMTLTIDAKLKQEIYECRDYRNTKDWFIYCRSYCNNFKMTAFSEFFQPNLHMYGEYTRFLRKQLAFLKDEEMRNPLVANADNGSSSTGGKKVKLRLLNEKKKDKDVDNVIFKPASGSRMILSEMETAFESDGLNLYQTGLKSQISQAVFDQLKTLANLKKMRESGQKLTPEQKGLINNVGKK